MKKLFVLPLLCAALLASCSKDDGPQNPPVKDTTTAQEYFEQSREEITESDKFANSDGKEFKSKSGKTTINFRPESFQLNGEAYAGNVNIEFVEVRPENLSRAIFSGSNTNYAGGQYLQTFGYLYVNATTDDGQQLDLVKNMRIDVATEETDGEWRDLWTFQEPDGPNNPAGGQNQFGWNDFDMKEDLIWADEEGIDWENQRELNMVQGRAGSFTFSFGKLGWVNVDVIWNPKGENTTITVTIGGMLGEWASYMGWSGNTYVFFIAEGYPVIVQIYTQVPGQSNAVQSYADQMPVGVKGKMLAFSVVDGTYSMAIQEVTTEANQEINLQLEEVTRETLDATIKSIDGYGNPDE